MGTSTFLATTYASTRPAKPPRQSLSFGVQSLKPAPHDPLLLRANAGDLQAMGVWLSEHQQYLRGMAFNISRGTYDAEDLLQEVLTSLVEKWMEGSGPTSQVNAYIARSMRNRLIDEYKSPRSRVLGINEEFDLASDIDPALRRAELHEEYRLVHDAMRRLPAIESSLLERVVIHGDRPAELAAELGRTRHAVACVLDRARNRLRYALFQVIRERQRWIVGCDCLAQVSPTRFPIPEAEEPALPLMRDCAPCQESWIKYRAVLEAVAA